VVSCNMADVSIGGMPHSGTCAAPWASRSSVCALKPSIPTRWNRCRSVWRACCARRGQRNGLLPGPTGEDGRVDSRRVVQHRRRGSDRAGRFHSHYGAAVAVRQVAGEMVPLEKLDDEMHEPWRPAADRVLAVAAVPDEKRGERLVVLYLPESRRSSPTFWPLCRSAASRTCGCRTAATATRWTRCPCWAAASWI